MHVFVSLIAQQQRGGLIDQLVQLIARLITTLADAIFSIVITLGTMLLLIPMAFLLAGLSVPITFVTIALMFAIKSGFLTRYLEERQATVLGISAGVTALAAAGSFGFLLLVMQYPDVRNAFFRMYGIYPHIGKLPTYDSLTHQAYVENISQYVHYAKIWFHMSMKDGLLFFISSAILLSLQFYARSQRSWLLQIAAAVVGGVLFALVIFGDELFAHLARFDLPMFFRRTVEHIKDEMWSVYELLNIPFGGRYTTFGAWLHDEIVKMGGSIYKMASIYPKLFIVLFVVNLVPSRNVL